MRQNTLEPTAEHATGRKIKRTATDRSTTSKPGPMRWEIAGKR